MIEEVKLFPGIVTVEGGTIVRVPALLLAVQSKLPKLTVCNVRVLGLPDPPVAAFQTTWIS